MNAPITMPTVIATASVTDRQRLGFAETSSIAPLRKRWVRTNGNRRGPDATQGCTPAEALKPTVGWLNRGGDQQQAVHDQHDVDQRAEAGPVEAVVQVFTDIKPREDERQPRKCQSPRLARLGPAGDSPACHEPDIERDPH